MVDFSIDYIYCTSNIYIHMSRDSCRFVNAVDRPSESVCIHNRL
jgi:hypothetical protein